MNESSFAMDIVQVGHLEIAQQVVSTINISALPLPTSNEMESKEVVLRFSGQLLADDAPLLIQIVITDQEDKVSYSCVAFCWILNVNIIRSFHPA